MQGSPLEARRPRGLVDQKAAAIQVTGDGHGHREFRNRPFGHRGLATGCWRLTAERLTPEKLTTVAVTRHLECIITEAYIAVSGLSLSECVALGGRWREGIQRGRGGMSQLLTRSNTSSDRDSPGAVFAALSL